MLGVYQASNKWILFSIPFRSCHPLCPPKVNIDQKLQLKGTCVICFGTLSFKWKLFRHPQFRKITDPTDTDSMKEVPYLDQITTTSIRSLDLAVKPDKLARDTYYTAVFRAERPSGQYGEYFHTFLTNSPPENGKMFSKFVSNLIISIHFVTKSSLYDDRNLHLNFPFTLKWEQYNTVYAQKTWLFLIFEFRPLLVK